MAILLLFLAEEDAFWGLVAIVESLMPAQYYDRTMMAAHADQVGQLTVHYFNMFNTVLTLGVVGVVGMFVAKIVGHFGGPKGAKIHWEAPICSSSQLSAMAVLSAQKVSAKKMWKF